MLRTLTLVVALALASIVTATPTQAHEHREQWCRYRTVQGGRGWSHHEVRLTIRCATERFGVSYQTALAIAERESGLNEGAVNPTSGACGIFQHIPTYWPGRVDAFNRARPRWNAAPSCFNARSNVLVSVRMMALGGWGHWGL